MEGAPEASTATVNEPPQPAVLEASGSPTLIYRPPTITEPLRLEQLYSAVRPLEVELGSGDGSFLIQLARLHPERNFLGVERLLGRLRKIDRKGTRAGLTNLRLLRLEAAYLLKYLLPDESVSALHVYFPDPWPKRKHRRHRLINPGFAGAARRVLQPGGRVFLRTDHEDYFADILSVFAADSAFAREESPATLLRLRTDFEGEFLARKIQIRHTAYCRL